MVSDVFAGARRTVALRVIVIVIVISDSIFVLLLLGLLVILVVRVVPLRIRFDVTSHSVLPVG